MLVFVAKDNVITQERIYKALDDFVSMELPEIRISEESWYGDLHPKARKKEGPGSYAWQCAYVSQVSKLDLIQNTDNLDDYLMENALGLMAL